MRNILLKNEELLAYRIKEITDLVKAIHPLPKRLQVTPLSQSGTITFAVTDRPIKSLEIKDYFFQTTAKHLRASYFEVWQREDKDLYYLTKSYFHLYRTDDSYLLNKRIDGEYVLLHCDPNENDIHGNYKRSPHIHIEAAEYPINKAHIALNLSNINVILKSRSELNIAIKSAIQMLKSQIIDKS